MPLRNEFWGRIDAARAAAISVEVTQSAGSGMDFTLPQGIFCLKFKDEVKATFKVKYPYLGERVTQ